MPARDTHCTHMLMWLPKCSINWRTPGTSQFSVGVINFNSVPSKSWFMNQNNSPTILRLSNFSSCFCFSACSALSPLSFELLTEQLQRPACGSLLYHPFRRVRSSLFPASGDASRFQLPCRSFLSILVPYRRLTGVSVRSCFTS